MSGPFHIEVDEVKMFAGYEWINLGEPCDHDCKHWGISVVAWGPTVRKYELYECDGEHGCGCRAWLDARWEDEHERGGDSGFWHQRMAWRLPVETNAASPEETEQ